MQLIDGKKVADEIKAEIAAEVAERVARGERRPHLAAVLVGHDGGSETYVAHKVKACGQCGFESTLIRREDDVTEEELLDIVARLNEDPSVDGYIVQLPFQSILMSSVSLKRLIRRKMLTGFIRSMSAVCPLGCHASCRLLLPA